MIDKHDRIFELVEQIHNLQKVAAAQTLALYENEVEQIIQRDIKGINWQSTTLPHLSLPENETL